MAKFTTALTVQLAVRVVWGVWSAPSWVEPTCQVLSEHSEPDSAKRGRSKGPWIL